MTHYIFFYYATEQDCIICRAYENIFASKMNGFVSNISFKLAGIRTEQDLYVRLIDSMTKQVSTF